MGEPWIAATADIDETALMGAGTHVGHLARVRAGAVLGDECVVGQGVYVGPGVRVGNRVKLLDHALVYEPAVLEDSVYVGPAAVLTNDLYPRATDLEGRLKQEGDWAPVGVTVRQGASVGARAVLAAGVTVGRWAMVADGAVVHQDVPDFALVAGAPALRAEWVGRAGVPLTLVDNVSGHWWQCPETGECYVERDGVLEFQI